MEKLLKVGILYGRQGTVSPIGLNIYLSDEMGYLPVYGIDISPTHVRLSL